MPNLLWVGDAYQNTGFERVTRNIVTRLVDRGWNTSILGINYPGDPHDYPCPVYPAIAGGDVFGLGRLEPLVTSLKPECVVINNDPYNVGQFAKVLRHPKASAIAKATPIVAYMPVDGMHMLGVDRTLDALDLAVWYTDFGAREAAAAGVSTRTAVVPHGVDLTVFYPEGTEAARTALKLDRLLGPGAFVLGNVNRNGPRKRLDLTIRAFAEFWQRAERPPDAWLYLHTADEPDGWNLEELVETCGLRGRVVLPSKQLRPGFGVPEKAMRLVYSMFSAQINTAMGEGWGLPAHEGAACRVAQLYTDYAGQAEWLGDAGVALPIADFHVYPEQINTWGGVVDFRATVDAIERVYFDVRYREQYAARAYARATEPRFQWDTIVDHFEELIGGVVAREIGRRLRAHKAA